MKKKAWIIIYNVNGVNKHTTVTAISKIAAIRNFLNQKNQLIHILDVSYA